MNSARDQAKHNSEKWNLREEQEEHAVRLPPINTSRMSNKPSQKSLKTKQFSKHSMGTAELENVIRERESKMKAEGSAHYRSVSSHSGGGHRETE